jgi:outer membrane lipoprotein SlyB
MTASITSMGNMDPILGSHLGKAPNNDTSKVASPPPTTKPLWAAIGVLGVSVLAMGAGLIHINKRPAEPVPTIVSASALRATQLANASGVGSDGGNSMITETADGKPLPTHSKTPDASAKPVAKKVAKPVERHAAAAPVATRSGDAAVAANTPRVGAPAATPMPANEPVATAPQPSAPVVQASPAVVQAPAKAVCANCGTIAAVTPVTRAGKASPVGAIAGGVLGGVIGHQVGDGRGKDIATVLGAVGGAVAGNAVEKNIKKETVYSVRVQMEDGSTRTIEQASAPAVGAKVRVDGSTLRSDG